MLYLLTRVVSLPPFEAVRTCGRCRLAARSRDTTMTSSTRVRACGTPRRCDAQGGHKGGPDWSCNTMSPAAAHCTNCRLRRSKKYSRSPALHNLGMLYTTCFKLHSNSNCTLNGNTLVTQSGDGAAHHAVALAQDVNRPTALAQTGRLMRTGLPAPAASSNRCTCPAAETCPLPWPAT